MHESSNYSTVRGSKVLTIIAALCYVVALHYIMTHGRLDVARMRHLALQHHMDQKLSHA